MRDLTISATFLEATHMTPQELLQEIAVMLFEKGKLTLAQASELAQLTRFQFQHLLASLNIPIHYDVEEFEEDLATLKKLGRL